MRKQFLQMIAKWGSPDMTLWWKQLQGAVRMGMLPHGCKKPIVTFISMELGMVAVVIFFRYLAMKSAEAMEARTSFRALDDAGLRLPVQLSFNKVGDTARLLDNLLICLNFLLHTCWAIPEQFVMFII